MIQLRSPSHTPRFSTAALLLALLLLLPEATFAMGDQPAEIHEVCKIELASAGSRAEGGGAPNLSPMKDEEAFDLEFVYRAFRTDRGLKAMPLPGDRLLARLAVNLSQFLGSPVSSEGQAAFEEFKAKFSLEIFTRNLRSLAGFSNQQIVEFLSVDGNSLMQRMVQARNHQDWDRVIEIYDLELNSVWRMLPEAKLQVALALNRRNQPASPPEQNGDRDRALLLVEQVFTQNPGKAILSEAAGVKGRIYKDLYKETGKTIFLDEALNSYRYGFELNPSDYYPGVAYLDLLFETGDAESVQRALDYSKRVAYSVESVRAKLKAQGKPLDYWLLSSQMQVAVLLGDWETVREIFPDVIANAAGPMNLQTSLDSYRRKRNTLSALGYPAATIEQIDQILFAYQSKIERPSGVGALTPLSLSYVSPVTFPKTEGIFSAEAFYLKKEIADSEVEQELQKGAAQHGISMRSFHKFLQSNTQDLASGGVILAPTGPYDSVIEEVARATGMRSWKQAYQDLGIALDPANTPQFLEALIAQAIPIFFFVPKAFKSVHAGSHTLAEFEYLMKVYGRAAKQTQFVFGFEKTFPLEWRERVSSRFVRAHYQEDVMRVFLQKFQLWLRSLGPDVRDYAFGTEFTASLYPTVYHQVLKHFPDHVWVRELHDHYMPEGTAFRPVTIVDIGAGTGLVSLHLLRAGKNRTVLLLEPSPAMSSVALSEGLIKPDMVSPASAQDLYKPNGDPFGDNSVEGVVSNNMIYLLNREEIRNLFREVSRILKPGGRFTVSSMRNASRDTHAAFLTYAKETVREMESEGVVSLGAAQILYDSNQNIIQNEPTLLSFEEVEGLAESFGLRRISDSITTYRGAGFFLAFEKAN